MTVQDLLRVWTSGPFQLELTATGHHNRDGRPELAYRFCDGGELIFTGEKFWPSPLHTIDSDTTIAALLGFLALQPGDTDQDYFATYTARQLAWADERGAMLALVAYELEPC
jgi:hypothetical protein